MTVMAWYLLADSNGKKSVSYTMMVTTFVVCTVWLALSMFNQIHHLEIREFDSGAASMWFAPIAALYFGRRWTDAKAQTEGQTTKGGDGNGNG